MKALEPVALAEIQAAAQRLRGRVVRTPLVRLQCEDAPAEIHLKLENLQPIGSFKLRGAGNALLQIPRERLAEGVCTASAGNMAQGVGWMARELGVPFQVAVPEGAPETKLESIRRLGGRLLPLPFRDWWNVLRDHGHPELRGHFVHPVSDPRVIAGNGTVGLEILEDLPDVETVVVPFGGGGLSSGIACALRALRPSARVYGAEVETGAPLARSLEAGGPQVIDHRPSFVDGIGAGSLLQEMWPLVREVLAGSLVVDLAAVARAVRLLVERHRVVAEGAGATSVAAALAGCAGSGKMVCVISGGNLDARKLIEILQGEVPGA